MRLPHSFTLLIFALLVNSNVTNTTIDDSSSNFTFIGIWNTITPESPCPGCSAKPDPSQIYNGTWHDGNVHSGGSTGTAGSFTFKGSAVYMFGIDQTFQADIAFTLGSIQSVHHYNGTEQFAYNALFFSATGLASDETHTLDWVLIIADTDVVVQVALFDYAIVTSGESTDTIVNAHRSISRTSSQITSSSSRATSSALSSSASRLTLSSASTGVSQTISTTISMPLLPVGQLSSQTVATVGGMTTVTAQSAASSHSKSKSNLGAIIGGAVGALVVATLAILALYIRSRQRRRMHSEREKTVRSSFIRIEDYPLHRLQSTETFQVRNTLPDPLLPSRRTVDTIAGTSAASLLDGYPLTDPTLFESPGIIGIISADNASNGNLRHLEERLATLEAQVASQQLQQPPPYIHD